MATAVIIYGKHSWPHTASARAAYERSGRPVEYISVVDTPGALERMLKLSGGTRKIPLIVDGDRIIVGYQGKGWTI